MSAEGPATPSGEADYAEEYHIRRDRLEETAHFGRSDPSGIVILSCLLL